MYKKSGKKMFLLMLLLFNGYLWLHADTIYVSTTGDNSFAGTIDKPMATIEAARDFIRMHPDKGKENFTVFIRGGRYTLNNTIIFSEQDGGNDTVSITYAAYQGEIVLLSGGVKIEKWIKETDSPLWSATVSYNKFRQFYVNNERKTRASTPRLKGLYWIEQVFDTNKYGIRFDSSAIPMFSKVTDAELHMNSYYRDAYVPIDSALRVDDEIWVYANKLKEVTEKYPESSTPGFNIPFTIENAYEFIDKPGEWYCDRSKNKLYYYPEEGEDMNKVEALIPVQERLITIKGHDINSHVKNLHFKGLTFCEGGWTAPNYTGWYGGQSTSLMQPISLTDAHVYLEFAKYISFKECIFTRLAATGLDFRNGIYHCTAVGNVFTDIGSSGISASSPGHRVMWSDDFDSCNYISIKNNVIYKCGVDYYAAPGISIYYVKGIEIEHNTLYDLPYSAISVGWGWESPNNTCMDNIIRRNKIGLFLKVTFDGGGIYTLGSQPGSVCSENYLYNQVNDYGAMYFDEGSCCYVAENNVVENVPRWLFIWTSSIHDISVNNTYTTTNNLKNDGTNITVQNTHVYPDANWPAEALNIIDSAGLTTSYKYLEDYLPDLDKNKAPVIKGIKPDYNISLFENLNLEPQIIDTTPPDDIMPVWKKKSGPGTVTFLYEKLNRTSLAFSTPGDYVIGLKVSDGDKSDSIDFQVQVTDYDLGVNYALNKVCKASSFWDNNPSMNANKAVDGDINSIWHPASGDSKAWWQIDMQQPIKASRIELVTRQNLDQPTARRNLVVFASNDSNFKSFKVLGSQSDNPFPFKGTWTLNTMDTSSYRYLRVKQARTGGHTIAEFRVYSIPDSLALPKKYALTVNNGVGTKEYLYGTLVTVTANTPAEGKLFDQWTGDIEHVDDVNSSSTFVIMPKASVIITATYKDAPPNMYTLTVINGTGSGNYTAGSIINIKANTPASGMQFDKWSGDIDSIENVNASSANIIMPAANTSISATYRNLSNMFSSSGSYPKIYPNPVHDVINLTGLEKSSLISMYDLNGVLLFQKKTADDFCIIDAYSLPAGFYIIKISCNGYVVSYKVIKE